MDNILDNEPKSQTPVKKYFSYLSLIFAVVTLVIGAMLMLGPEFFLQIGRGLAFVIQLAWYFRLTCLLGLACAVISFLRKEPSSKIKWAGAVINGLNLLVIIASVLFAMSKDGAF